MEHQNQKTEQKSISNGEALSKNGNDIYEGLAIPPPPLQLRNDDSKENIKTNNRIGIPRIYNIANPFTPGESPLQKKTAALESSYDNKVKQLSSIENTLQNLSDGIPFRDTINNAFDAIGKYQDHNFEKKLEEALGKIKKESPKKPNKKTKGPNSRENKNERRKADKKARNQYRNRKQKVKNQMTSNHNKTKVKNPFSLVNKILLSLDIVNTYDTGKKAIDQFQEGDFEGGSTSALDAFWNVASFTGIGAAGALGNYVGSKINRGIFGPTQAEKETKAWRKMEVQDFLLNITKKTGRGDIFQEYMNSKKQFTSEAKLIQWLFLNHRKFIEQNPEIIRSFENPTDILVNEYKSMEGLKVPKMLTLGQYEFNDYIRTNYLNQNK